MGFSELIHQVEQRYFQLGHTLGWRFLTSPRATFSPKTEFAFITLNPGGNKITHDEVRESCEHGSPYVVEQWKSYPEGKEPLQQQIQKLYQMLGWDFDSVLSGQFVPFRSPTWAELPNRNESLQFGIELWGEIIRHVKPRLIVAMGKSQLRTPLVKALGTPIMSESHSVGWGKISAGLDIFEDCVLVSLPHLSRFQIMGRSASSEQLKELFNHAKNVEHLRVRQGSAN